MVSEVAGQDVPPFAEVNTTVLVRFWLPPPHLAEHSVHEVHGLT